jgi:hypothetical protein
LASASCLATARELAALVTRDRAIIAHGERGM